MSTFLKSSHQIASQVLVFSLLFYSVFLGGWEHRLYSPLIMAACGLATVVILALKMQTQDELIKTQEGLIDAQRENLAAHAKFIEWQREWMTAHGYTGSVEPKGMVN